MGTYKFHVVAADTFGLNALSNVLYNRGIMADRFINSGIWNAIILGVVSFFLIKHLFAVYLAMYHIYMYKKTLSDEELRNYEYAEEASKRHSSIRFVTIFTAFMLVATYLSIPNEKIINNREYNILESSQMYSKLLDKHELEYILYEYSIMTPEEKKNMSENAISAVDFARDTLESMNNGTYDVFTEK